MSSFQLYFLAISFYGGRELEIIPSPRASIERESSEFFQVPELIWGRGGELGIFPSPKDYVRGEEILEFL